jgi:electron transfer flavoprotein beta subunit
MGADEGVLIDDAALNDSDSLGVAKALASAARGLNPDIILCGHRAVDYDQGQRGPMVAELLNWPHVGPAVSLDSDNGRVSVERAVEGGKITIEADLPALVTLGGSHGVWNPRYASLPGIMKAKKKPLALKTLDDLGLTAEACGGRAAKIKLTKFEMPPRREAGRIINGDLDTEGKARELIRLLTQEANVL